MNVDKNKISIVNAANPYVDITPYELQIGFPFVSYMGFFPQSEEILIYAAPANIFSDKEKIVGYKEESRGYSYNVTKNRSVIRDSSSGRPIRENVRDFMSGDLLITNKRILFTGKDDSFEFAVRELSTVKLLDRNSFIIQAGQSSKNIYLNENLIAYAYGFIDYVVNETNRGVDIYKAILDTQNQITPEQLNTCNQIKQEAIGIYMSMSNQKKRKAKPMRYVIPVLITIGVIYAIISGAMQSEEFLKDANISTASDKVKYSDIDLLNLEGHPVIYTDFEKSREFYRAIGTDRVKVVSLDRYSALQRKIKKISDDKVMLYLIGLPESEKFIGRIHINLFEPELCAEMDVNKAVEIMASYLPDDFLTNYKEDRSYQYSNGTTTIYTYSCRLNEHGVEVHNNGHGEYSYYYNFKIIHYGDVNQWTIESDYAAYGDKDLGWIDKNTTSWDVDLSKFIN